MTQSEAAVADLRNQLRALMRRDGAITRDLRGVHDDDSSEQAIERENDTVLERLDDATRAEVGRIRGALARIEQGRYGICDACQGPIAPERLRALPTATLCFACAMLACGNSQ